MEEDAAFEEKVRSLDTMNPIQLMAIFNQDLKLRAYIIRNGYLERALGKFDLLDGNVLSLIAKNLAPFEVILFCTRSLAFRNLCGKKSFWSSMLGNHYGKYIVNDEKAKREYFKLTNFWYSIKLRWYEGEQITLRDDLGNKYPDMIGTIESDPPTSLISTPLTDAKQYPYMFGYPAKDFGMGTFWYAVPYNFISSRSTIWLGITYRTFSEFSWGRGGNGKEEALYLFGKTKLEVIRQFVDSVIEEDYPSTSAMTVEETDQQEERHYPSYREGMDRAALRESTIDYIDRNGFLVLNADMEMGRIFVFSVNEVRLQNSNSPDYDIYEEDFIDDYDRKRKPLRDGDLVGEPFY